MSRRQRMRRRRARGGHGGRIVAFSFGIILVLLAIGALSGVAYILTIAADAPDIDTLKPVDKGAVSQVYAADGRRLGFIESTDLRTPIPDRMIPGVAKRATVAIEDQRFYQHGGVDPEGIIRAAIRNLGSGKTLQGGSTITQQLVRNLYISPERTFARKIKEAKLAEELEAKHSKRWILDKYLNSVSYGTVGGQSAVGLQAASRLFFYKPVDLDLQKAARKAIAGQLYYPSDPASAIVSIDPRTGYIRAMASSGKYGKNKFNYAAQGHRQPGSTAKVWVLMTALRNGVDPDRTTYN